jgi:hypothetical protein
VVIFRADRVHLHGDTAGLRFIAQDHFSRGAAADVPSVVKAL